MQLLKTIQLITTFYRSFAFASILATAFCVFLFWKYGFSVFMGVFWFRLAVSFFIFYFINSYKSKEYYYYQNLGISKKQLWFSAIGFDMFLFIALLTQIHRLQ